MARSRKVAFNEDAANRIVRATLAYERGNRDQSPIRFRTADDGGELLRIARTTGETPKGLQSWVEYVYRSSCDDEGSGAGSEPEVGVTGENAWNLLYHIAAGVDVIIGRAENGCWYIVGPASCPADGSGGSGSGDCGCTSIGGEDLTLVEGFDETKVQLLGHEQGCLKWINTTDCDQGSGSGS
jgi:hypothetical protein